MKTEKYKKKIENQAGILLMLLMFSLSLFSSCRKNNHEDDQTPPPLPANIIQKEAISGGVILSYDVPDVKDLLYVQARYFANDKERISKATPYENTLKVGGFGKVQEYDVWISSVDKSGNHSEETKIVVTPQTPPTDLVFSTLDIDVAFGGLSVAFDNKAGEKLIIETLVKDIEGGWQVLDSRATSKKREEFIIKDGIVFLDQPQNFKTYIKDRWGNVSDTLSRALKPLFEEVIDFRHVTTYSHDDDDDSWPGTLYLAKFLTDGIATNSNNYIYHSGPETTWPVSLTIDLGTEIKISSYKMFPRYNYEYKNHGIKEWQLWARDDTPPETTDSDPDFAPARTGWKIGDTYANIPGDSGWMLISQTATNRPSGPDGPVTSEDIAWARAGEDHLIPSEIAKSNRFRYMKICIQRSYSMAYVGVAEITFYGEYQGEKPKI